MRMDSLIQFLMTALCGSIWIFTSLHPELAILFFSSSRGGSRIRKYSILPFIIKFHDGAADIWMAGIDHAKSF